MEGRFGKRNSMLYRRGEVDEYKLLSYVIYEYEDMLYLFAESFLFRCYGQWSNVRRDDDEC